ncbi:hypothetical protein ACOMHN_052637 [Nucella lapillus]
MTCSLLLRAEGAEKPLLFRKLAHAQRIDVVKDFLVTLNKSDPREIRGGLEMVCISLGNNRTVFSSQICDGLLHGHSLATAYRLSGDLAYTDMKVPQASIYVLVPVFCVELCVSLCGNNVVMWSFIFRRQMRSVTNFFIVSLAASDLLLTLSSIPLNIAQVLTGFWQFGPTMCKLGPFTTKLSVAASSLTLCCIALDRYLAVVHPLRLSSIQSPRRAVMLMTAVWLVALAAAAPFIHYHELLELCEWPAEQCALYCGMPVSLQWLHWLTYVVLLLLPMLLVDVSYAVVIYKRWGRTTVGGNTVVNGVECLRVQYKKKASNGVSYAVIIYKLWGRTPVGGSTVVNGVECLRVQYKKKAIKMLFLVMLIFVTCWMPLLTFDLLAKLLRLPLTQRLVTLRYYLQCLALSATCLNPMVYAILHDKFRKNFSKLCCNSICICPCPCSSPSSTHHRVTPLVRLPPRPLPRSPAAAVAAAAAAAASLTHSEEAEGRSDILQPPLPLEKIFQVEVPQQTWVEKFGPSKC